MKRIAALAAVMFGLLAIPTAALASTSSPGDGGPGYGYGNDYGNDYGNGYGYGSGYGTTVYGQPYECYYGFHRVHHGYHKYFDWWRHGRKFTAAYCPFQQQVPLGDSQSQQCQTQGQALVFSVAAGSSQLTEVSGPQLSPTQEFSYDGSTYTVMTVNPGADQFTAFVNNALFTSGSAITDASGVMVACSS